MKLEEKTKEIENLSKNLDEKIFATIKQRFPDNENTVCLDAGHLHATFDIDDEKEYNDLIDFLTKTLHYTPSKRMSLTEIKNHNWLKLIT